MRRETNHVFFLTEYCLWKALVFFSTPLSVLLIIIVLWVTCSLSRYSFMHRLLLCLNPEIDFVGNNSLAVRLQSWEFNYKVQEKISSKTSYHKTLLTSNPSVPSLLTNNRYFPTSRTLTLWLLICIFKVSHRVLKEQSPSKFLSRTTCEGKIMIRSIIWGQLIIPAGIFLICQTSYHLFLLPKQTWHSLDIHIISFLPSFFSR